MHCFVPLLAQRSLLSAHHHHHDKRHRHDSSEKGDSSSCGGSAGCLTESSSASSLSTCASTTSTSSFSTLKSIPETRTTTTTVATTPTKEKKKSVRFAEQVTIHCVMDLRRWKHHHQLWWQVGELPSGARLLNDLLECTTAPYYSALSLSTPGDRARRLRKATYRLLAVQAGRRGVGGVRCRRAAAADWQASMTAAWRGLEGLLVHSDTPEHVLHVLAAQYKNKSNNERHGSLVDAGRRCSRPAAQLALERARWDAREAGYAVDY